MKIIFVSSPLKGDIKNNIRRAIEYSKFVYKEGHIPLAPHTIFTMFLDDNVKEEREDGMKLGIGLLKVCDELWAFGDILSQGMLEEIKIAKEMGIEVRRFNERCE